MFASFDIRAPSTITAVPKALVASFPVTSRIVSFEMSFKFGLTVNDPGSNCITSTILEACTCSNAAFLIEEELFSLFPDVAVTVTSFSARVCSSNFRMYFSIFLLRLIFIS